MKFTKLFYILFIFIFCFDSALAGVESVKESSTQIAKKSDSEIIFKNNAYVMAPILVVGFAKWDWGNLGFHKKDEGFFQENTRYGGVDKAGHFYSSYLIADLLSKKFASDGIAMERASFYGATSSFVLTTLIEVGDATSPRYGFSYQDQLMNTLGALSSYVLLNSPSLNEKIDFKIDYIPTSGPLGFDDYEGMRFIASLKLSGFDFAKNSFWRFIEIQANYSAPGYVKRKDDKSRELGIGLALNVNEVIDYFRGRESNKYVHGFFEYYQPRYTYVTYDKNLNH